MADYNIQKESTLHLVLRLKGHEWVYTVESGNVLIGKCNVESHKEEDCAKTGVCLTLSADSPNYSGSAVTINIGTADEREKWKKSGLELPTIIEYYKGNKKLDVVPTAAGKYTAKVSPAGVEATAKNTATVDFEIKNNGDDVTEIRLSKCELKLEKGKTYQLRAIISPDTATNKNVEWSSNNEDVATVDENGLVTAVTTGDAVIIAKSEQDEDIKAECKVKVVEELQPSEPEQPLKPSKPSSSSSSSSSSKKSHKKSSSDRPLAKNSDGKIAGSVLSKEIYANIVIGNDLVNGAGLSADKVNILYELNADDFKGNIAILSDTVINDDGSSSDQKYIYIKCINTKKSTLKVDVSSLNINELVYVYKIDAIGNLEFIKMIDGQTVKDDDKFVEIPVAKGQNYIISDTKMKENKVSAQIAQPSDTVKEGWNQAGENWTYFENGKAVTGWKKDIDGKWYYMNNSGIMQTGWIKDAGSWYYLNKSGAMKTGWIQYAGKWYFLNSNGSMAVNTTVNGYNIGSDGAWTKIN